LSKPEWRRALLSARRLVSAAVHTAEARALAESAVAAAAGTTGPVCCYVPIGTEPGSLAVLDELRHAGHTVLLPVLPDNTTNPSAMSWACYQGPSSLVAGPHGLRQPGGPLLPPTAIASSALILVPGLAVDHRGVRLGRGAGWYDRTLPLARPGSAIVSVVRDDELVALLPSEPHDVLMTAVLTPLGGLRALPLRLD
jgi:5-formyltetrahydrofolate cyclo-ligase